MDLLYGLAFMLVVVFVLVAVVVYYFLTSEPPTKPKPSPPKPKLTPPPRERETKGIYIPPEVPRTVGTIKQMVDGDMESVLDVVKIWLKKSGAPIIGPKAAKKKKRL